VRSEEERMGVLEGKRALVTGAGTGIGRSIAREFAREGATVALHYSHSDKGARETTEEILSAGGKAAAFRADFSHRDQVRRLAAEAAGFLGGVDILVNCAGVTMTLPIEEVTDEQFDLVYEVNVAAPFFLTQALLPHLRKSKAAVINFSSIHAYEGFPDHTVYAGTRGAMVSYTRVLAIELAPLGIRVNGIAPGSTWVENHKKAAPNTDVAAAGREIPVGFLGEPEDMARVAVFLASPAARFILGQTIVVDGGTTSWMPFGEGYLQRTPPNMRLGKGYVPGV
jgi:NAD(P)-dependent dehydrogenase (short-subunit alcohol dehydrogenase family)